VERGGKWHRERLWASLTNQLPCRSNGHDDRPGRLARFVIGVSPPGPCGTSLFSYSSTIASD
jgi:hypothetical protein